MSLSGLNAQPQLTGQTGEFVASRSEGKWTPTWTCLLIGWGFAIAESGRFHFCSSRLFLLTVRLFYLRWGNHKQKRPNPTSGRRELPGKGWVDREKKKGEKDAQEKVGKVCQHLAKMYGSFEGAKTNGYQNVKFSKLKKLVILIPHSFWYPFAKLGVKKRHPTGTKTNGYKYARFADSSLSFLSLIFVLPRKNHQINQGFLPPAEPTKTLENQRNTKIKITKEIPCWKLTKELKKNKEWQGFGPKMRQHLYNTSKPWRP